jgi:hypothetical protein
MATYQYIVDLTWPGSGSPGISAWNFRAEGSVGSSEQGPVDAIRDYWGDVLGSGYLIDAMFARGRAECVNVATKEIVPVTPWVRESTATAGNYAGPLMMCSTLLTASATRSGRGRKFLGPVTAGSMSADGSPVAGAVTAFQTAGDDLVSTSSGLTQSAVGVYSPTEGIFRDLTGWRQRDYFAVLRSRRD